MELLQVTNYIDLAEKLGMQNSGKISVWKNRGKVPDKTVREWSQKYGKPVEWFMEEEEVKAALGDIETALIGMMKGVPEEVKKDIFMSAAEIISGGNRREK